MSIRVSVGPVYVSIQSGRCEHGRWASVADRAPYQGFMWFLAVIQPIRWANGVQGVADQRYTVSIFASRLHLADRLKTVIRSLLTG